MAGTARERAGMMFTVDQVKAALGTALREQRPGEATSFAAVANDSRTLSPGALFVALETEARDGHEFVADAVARGAAGVVLRRDGIAVPEGVWLFRVGDTWHAIGELARAYRERFDVKAIAVAGNVGKTTTKELIASLLANRFEVLKSHSNFNDEVGLAMTLFELQPAHERAVLELAMFELGEIRRLCEIARPEIAVVMNVGPTHLSRLGSMAAIARAKAEVVEALPAHGTAVLNADDAYVAAMAERTRARVLSFGLESDATVRATDLRSRGLRGVDFTLRCGGRAVQAHSPLPGARLVANALAAVSVALVEGFSLEEAAGALAVADVPQRLQVRKTRAGALLLDDCYNAGPASMLAALDVLAETPGRRLALLGDMLELGSAEREAHRRLGEQAASVVDVLFTIGDRGELIGDAARDAGAREVRHFTSREQAVEQLGTLLGPGDVLLVKASHGLHLEAVVKELAQ
jgi:UDP-N-acetylmuramoyl-tripeptide--D-alanyl-D-alanine ligase